MKRPDLIVYDFDGVMTDNRVLVDQDGKEAVFASRADGYGVTRIREMGIPQIILSTEVNPVVEMRGMKLNIHVIHGVKQKEITLKKYLDDNNINPENVMYVGNDLNDYEAMMLVGFRCAPKDAEPEIIDIADWVSRKNGGYGVIRELYRELSEEE